MKVVIHPKSEWELLPKAKDAGVGKLDGLRRAVGEVINAAEEEDAVLQAFEMGAFDSLISDEGVLSE